MRELSVSEARAEALTVLLRCLLRRMPDADRKALLLAAAEEAADSGVPAICEELRYLFA